MFFPPVINFTAFLKAYTEIQRTIPEWLRHGKRKKHLLLGTGFCLYSVEIVRRIQAQQENRKIEGRNLPVMKEVEYNMYID